MSEQLEITLQALVFENTALKARVDAVEQRNNLIMGQVQDLTNCLQTMLASDTTALRQDNTQLQQQCIRLQKQIADVEASIWKGWEQ